jgi:acyl-CoA synthetase (NDP forming)
MAPPGTELLIGVTRDPAFGPVVAVGMGGAFVEIVADVAVDLPPISPADAGRMLRMLRGWPLLDGARGSPRADEAAVAKAIQAIGELALWLGDRLEAIDVNPLFAYPEGNGVLAVDALIRLR